MTESPYGTSCRDCGSSRLTQDPDEPRVADCEDCGSFNIGPDSEGSTVKTRICIDFPDAAAAREWLDAAVDSGMLPSTADAYQADALDFMKPSASPIHTYMVRNYGDRPAPRRLAS